VGCGEGPPVEETGAQCSDTVDNDGDGSADCADSGCSAAAGCQFIASNDAATTPEDTVLRVEASTLLANDTLPAGRTLSVSAVSAAVHGTVALTGTQVTFTPDSDFAGEATFEYTLSDGTFSDTGRVAVTVTPVNDAPVAVDDSATTTEDAAVPLSAASLLANDSNLEADTLTLSAVGSATNGAVSLLGGSVTFSPDANFFGEASFEYTVSDGTVSDTGRVTVTVTAVGDDAPVAMADQVRTHRDFALTLQPVANDTDPDGDALVLLSADSPLNGTVVLNPEGTATFTPAAGFYGTAGFRYLVGDGSLTAEGVVTVAVIGCGNGSVDPLEPTGIRFEYLASSCGEPAVVRFTINGSPAHSDTVSLICYCEGATTVTVTDPAVLALLVDGSNDFGVSVDGEVRFSWAVATVQQGAFESEVIVYDAWGGAATRSEEFCSGISSNLTSAVASGLGETCDDGGNTNGDGCSAVCQEVCGDGFLHPDQGEQCDDGNTTAGDGCEADCTVACASWTGARRAWVSAGQCYFSFGDFQAWSDARSDCLFVDADLATVNDGTENQFLDSILGHGSWIGLNDLAVDGTFEWASGAPVSFVNWAGGEPNGGTSENCAQLYDGALWNDSPCSQLNTYVCETAAPGFR